MDLLEPTMVAGIVSQPGQEGAYVTDFGVSYSLKNKEVHFVKMNGFFKGTDKGKTEHIFATPVLAQYVWIHPRVAEKMISMRCDVLIAVQIADTAEQNRKYSSVLNEDLPGAGRAQSKIDSEVCWTPAVQDTNQWLELDLGAKARRVGGTVIAGAGDDCGQWVRSYKVSTKKEGGDWQEIPGTYSGDGNGLSKQVFTTIMRSTRYLRIYPKEWHSCIGMRAEALIIPGTMPIHNYL